MSLKIADLTNKNLIAEIIKIIPPKKSRNEDTAYTRIEFLTEDGKFVKTDICEIYRNYRRWKRIARVGVRLANLRMRDWWTVDADSWPIKLSRKKDEPKIDLSNLQNLAKYCL